MPESRLPSGGTTGELADRTARVLPPERHRVISQLVRARGSVRIGELADRFSVTDETIRRDLEQLTQLGAVERSYGGAIAPRNGSETPFAGRLLEHSDEKVAIATFARGLIDDGDALIIDAGTTTLCLIRALTDATDLFVATNAVTHAIELVSNPRIEVVVIGGSLRRSTYAAGGELAIGMLRDLHVRRTFLAIHSVSARTGLTDPQLAEVGVKRALMQSASEVILLADHTKIGRESLVRVAPVEEVTRIITSRGADEASVRAIRDLGVMVDVV
jgi:DeoR family transcriptional regulator, fructose operon transcriptional repressor